MGTGFAHSEVDKLQEELDGIHAIIKGKVPGIISNQFRLEDLKELKSLKDDKEQEADAERKHALIMGAAYARAALRDALYAARGRKFMRATALTSKARALWGRAINLEYIEDSLK